MNSSKILLIILIYFASLCGIYLGFVFFIGSGFIFAGDIDFTEEQRNAEQIWVVLGSLFGLVLMIASFSAIVLSGVIVKFLLKLSGTDSITKLDI
ncbi:MAG: hypothetical protein ABI891_09495 [Acidobacteriota bacterium]